MAVPVRPIFQNGQRLTAERLNAALEFLRTTVRRLALGPLSAGVAAGLELSPRFPSTSDRFTVRPGVGIDGRGRLMVLEFAQTFTVSNIESALGGQLRAGDTVEVRLEPFEDTGTPHECGPNNEVAVLENAVISIVRSAPLPTGSPDPTPINCVNPWEDLDGSGSGQDCGITLGHVTLDAFGQLQALTDLRQGVSALLGRVRNTAGNQAMFFGESTTSDIGRAEMIRATHPLVVDGRLVANNASNFHNTARFDQLFGGEVQATLIGTNGTVTSSQVAGMWPLDPRIFIVAGGGGGLFAPTNVPNGQGALSAIQARVHPQSPGFISRPGVPLKTDVDGGRPVVREFLPGADVTTLVGLSAAGAAFLNGFRAVPIATAGLVEVLIADNTRAFAIGTPLTPHLTQPTKLTPNDSNGPILARAAQSSDGTATKIAAWVVYPPQNLDVQQFIVQ
jgi:hypothetical protein